MPLIPWLPLLWEFTSSETLVLSNLFTSSSGASHLKNSAESAKVGNYSSLVICMSFYFSPLSVEILDFLFVMQQIGS